MKVYRTLIFVIFLSFLSFYSVGCGKNKSDNSKKIIKNTEITFEITKTEEIRVEQDDFKHMMMRLGKIKHNCPCSK